MKFAMMRRKRGITMSGDNRQIRRKVVISYAAGKRKRVLKTPFTEVVEEKAADASLFVTVTKMEIIVAGGLESGIEIAAERGTRLKRGLMPVDRIDFVTIVRRQIESAAEPPDQPRRCACTKKPYVHMRGRNKWIVWVHHQGDSRRLKRTAPQLRMP